MPSRSPSSAKGTPRKNTARQPNWSTITPPSVGPSAGAITTPTAYSPIADPRRSAGNTWKMICMPSGCTIPAAAPCITRPAISTPSLGAAPETIDPHTNITIAAAYVIRQPKLSTSQPFSSMVAVTEARKAVAISCAWSCPMPKAPITCGSATFTIVADRMVATVPIIAASVTSQR